MIIDVSSAINMESDQNKDTFRVPEQPKRGPGGKREGSGRKKKYGDSGYKRVKGLLWKNITVHTHVHDEWTRLREQHGFKNNTDFATHLLEMKTTQATQLNSSSTSIFGERDCQRY